MDPTSLFKKISWGVAQLAERVCQQYFPCPPFATLFILIIRSYEQGLYTAAEGFSVQLQPPSATARRVSNWLSSSAEQSSCTVQAEMLK